MSFLGPGRRVHGFQSPFRRLHLRAENLVIKLGHHLAGLDFIPRFHRNCLDPAGDLKRQVRFRRLDMARQLDLILRFFLTRPNRLTGCGAHQPK